MWRAVVLTLLIANGAFAQRGRPVRPDSLVLKDSVVAAELRFFARWDSLWTNAERYDNSFAAVGDMAGRQNPRTFNLHCHPDDMDLGANGAFAQKRGIKSDTSNYAVCPSWELGGLPQPKEERIAIDTVLTEQDRVLARAARADLLRLLDSAVRKLPADSFLVGQRVRFLLDQRDLDGALAAAQSCASKPWWCGMLSGYVRAMRGEVITADSTFTAAFALMPADTRCAWTDYHFVLEEEWRGKYIDVPCDKRDAVNTRLWWLSDPLFLEPGNARKVEQYARTVNVALRTALEREERYSWDWKIGNDARRQMLIRYGVPSYAGWGGVQNDIGHNGYLKMNRSYPNPPYTSFEYHGARAHFVPAWSAVLDPFRALANDWDLNPPDPRENPPPPPKPVAAAPTPKLFQPAVKADLPPPPPKFWWPAEHFQPSMPIAQLPDGQNAMLRRQRGALLAVATDIGALRIGRRNGDTVQRIALVTSTAPDSVQSIAVANGIVGTAFELHAIIPSVPALAGLEFLPSGPRAAVAGRLRFGVQPPEPLSVMAANDVAISNPIILRAPARGELPNEAETALKLMATSHTIDSTGKLGIYWETYGFKPTEPVEVAVWIERFTSQGIARRFGVALRVATDLNTPIATSWKEPDPSHRVHVTSDGPVSIIGRAVVMDVGSLPAGDYWLDVAVRRPGAPEVRGRTSFIRK